MDLSGRTESQASHLLPAEIIGGQTRSHFRSTS